MSSDGWHRYISAVVFTVYPLAWRAEGYKATSWRRNEQYHEYMDATRLSRKVATENICTRCRCHIASFAMNIKIKKIADLGHMLSSFLSEHNTLRKTEASTTPTIPFRL